MSIYQDIVSAHTRDRVVIRAHPSPSSRAQRLPPLNSPAAPSQETAPIEKAMSIYQDIVSHSSRYVGEKELCLFIKTPPWIA
jgi:hypothetical protein